MALGKSKGSRAAVWVILLLLIVGLAGFGATNFGGNVRAIGELQRVATRHPASKNHLRHLLAIADLYSTLAREYAAARPPETLSFDPPTFQELVDAATRLYERVAAVDGTPEKLEAARRLEAFLAFTLRVDGERFSPQ